MEEQDTNTQNVSIAPPQTQTTQDSSQPENTAREPSTQASEQPQADAQPIQTEDQPTTDTQDQAVPATTEPVVATNTETAVIPKEADPNAPKIYAYGSCECDQFYVSEDDFESARPIDISKYFINAERTVFSVACGALHSLILLTTGEVYSFGCNDDGALGRPTGEGIGNEKLPAKVDLPVPVDMISAGDSHSIACNSSNSLIFQWGVYRTILGGNLSSVGTPHRIGEKEFGKKKVKKIVSGANHTLVLIEGKVYAWGDSEACILGRLPTEKRKIAQGLNIEGLGVRGVEDVFAGSSHSFIVRKYKKRGEGETTSVFSWGLNNFGQLGIGTFENTATPTEIPEFDGKTIVNITGGEHHTIVLTGDGEVYGFGKNDEGQLGLGEDFKFPEEPEEEASGDKIEEEKPKEGEEKEEKAEKMEEEKPKKEEQSTERISRPIKLKVENIEKIFSASQYNYAVSKNQEVYSWGMGDNYVLGTREEETVYEPTKINPKFFKEAKPYWFGLGAQHVICLTAEDVSKVPQLEEGIFDEIKPAKKVVVKKTNNKDKMEEEEEKVEKKHEKKSGKKNDKKEEEEEEDEGEEEKEEKKPTRGRSKAKKVEKEAPKTKAKGKSTSKSASKPKEKKETKSKAPAKAAPKKVGKRKNVEERDESVKKVKKAPVKTAAKSASKSKSTRGKSAKRK